MASFWPTCWICRRSGPRRTEGIYGLVLVHVTYGIPFTTLFFRNYFVTVPNDIMRAARIDGAGFWAILYRVLLPISWPIIMVAVIWQFTGI